MPGWRVRRRDVAAIWRLGAPLLVANLALAGMPFADTVMAGRIGSVPLAAVAIGSSFYALFMYFGLGVMTALSPLSAHAYGAGTPAAVGAYARQAVWVWGVLTPVLVAALWTVGPVLAWIGTSPDVAPVARDYVHALAFGLPGLLLAHGQRSLIEGVGRTRVIMAVTTVALVINVTLNWLLMYGHGGFPALGAVGAGVATSLSQSVMAAIYGWILSRHRSFAPYGLKDGSFRPSRERLRDLLALGLPIGGTMVAETGLFSSAGLMIGTLGAATVAAHQIALNYASFMFMAPLSLNAATTVYVGHALGGGDTVAARRRGFVGVGLCGLLMAISAAVILVDRHAIAALYTPDPAVQTAAGGLLLLAGIFQVSDGVQVGAMGALRGFKDTRVPLLITLAAYWGIGFPVAFTAGLRYGHGPVGIWWGLITGLAVAAVLLLLRLERVSRARQGAVTVN